jgi:hypothetical protein
MTDAEMVTWLETQYYLNENGCWVWKGCKDAGYGKIIWKGTYKLVHRLFWLLSGRTIPEGLHILHGHNCSKACFNPDHLKPGTQTENMADRLRDGTNIGAKGEKNSRAKLTEAQVLAIRANIDNKTHRELGQEYGVARETISNIILGKTWTHIT